MTTGRINQIAFAHGWPSPQLEITFVTEGDDFHHQKRPQTTHPIVLRQVDRLHNALMLVSKQCLSEPPFKQKIGHIAKIASLLDGPRTKASRADSTPMPRRKNNMNITLCPRPKDKRHRATEKNI